MSSEPHGSDPVHYPDLPACMRADRAPIGQTGTMSPGGDGPSTRVGDAERSAAIETLNEHWRAGRLDPTEHEARTTRAHGAVTRGDLDALFTDLPAQPLAGSALSKDTASAPGPMPAEVPSGSGGHGGGLFPADSWIGRRRDAIMGVTPFVATAAFFAAGNHWQWFLLVPALGAALYSGQERHESRDQRRRERDERRRLRRGRD